MGLAGPMVPEATAGTHSVTGLITTLVSLVSLSRLAG